MNERRSDSAENRIGTGRVGCGVDRLGDRIILAIRTAIVVLCAGSSISCRRAGGACRSRSSCAYRRCDRTPPAGATGGYIRCGGRRLSRGRLIPRKDVIVDRASDHEQRSHHPNEPLKSDHRARPLWWEARLDSITFFPSSFFSAIPDETTQLGSVGTGGVGVEKCSGSSVRGGVVAESR